MSEIGEQMRGKEIKQVANGDLHSLTRHALITNIHRRQEANFVADIEILDVWSQLNDLTGSFMP
jgi:hypothetical protein